MQKRFSRGLTFDVAYAYASYLSDAGNINGGGNSDYQNGRCVACNWGPTPDDYTHVLSINHLYELPFGTSRAHLNSGWASKVFGNWDINGIWSANTGGRFTPILGTNVSNSSGGGDQRPNRIASGILASGQSIHNWFNSAAFVAPAAYTFGNSGTGILEGPGMFNVNLGLIRHFVITERWATDFRLEGFNAFNRANFNTPNATIGTSQAGVISATGPARILQAALKVTF